MSRVGINQLVDASGVRVRDRDVIRYWAGSNRDIEQFYWAIFDSRANPDDTYLPERGRWRFFAVHDHVEVTFQAEHIKERAEVIDAADNILRPLVKTNLGATAAT